MNHYLFFINFDWGKGQDGCRYGVVSQVPAKMILYLIIDDDRPPLGIHPRDTLTTDGSITASELTPICFG